MAASAAKIPEDELVATSASVDVNISRKADTIEDEQFDEGVVEEIHKEFDSKTPKKVIRRRGKRQQSDSKRASAKRATKKKKEDANVVVAASSDTEEQEGNKTMWDLVKTAVKHKRRPPEETTPCETAANETENALRDIFGDSFGASEASSAMQRSNGLRTPTQAPLDQIFGSVSGSSESLNSTLHVDASGNFVIGNASNERPTRRGGDDFFSLLEGRGVVSENLSAGFGQVPRYPGAYKYTKATKWTDEQDERFFRALRLFGTDLSLVKTLFPEFKLGQIYRKYKCEEKRNPERLEECFNCPLKLSTVEFEEVNGVINPREHYRPEKDPYLFWSDSD